MNPMCFLPIVPAAMLAAFMVIGSATLSICLDQRALSLMRDAGAARCLGVVGSVSAAASEAR